MRDPGASVRPACLVTLKLLLASGLGALGCAFPCPLKETLLICISKTPIAPPPCICQVHTHLAGSTLSSRSHVGDAAKLLSPAVAMCKGIKSCLPRRTSKSTPSFGADASSSQGPHPEAWPDCSVISVRDSGLMSLSAPQAQIIHHAACPSLFSVSLSEGIVLPMHAAVNAASLLLM